MKKYHKRYLKKNKRQLSSKLFFVISFLFLTLAAIITAYHLPQKFLREKQVLGDYIYAGPTIPHTDSIQLGSFTPLTPTPQPINTPLPNPTRGFPRPLPTTTDCCFSCESKGGGATCLGCGRCCIQDAPPGAGSCCHALEPTSGLCDAKPVIYLYPTIPTFIDVTLSLPGKVVVSDPTYPEEGWKNIYAFPDGKLLYRGNTYRELFYEADITRIDPPTRGFVVSQNDIGKTLSEIAYRFGLIQSEKQEFLEYWLPRLTSLKAPYMFISVYSPEQKNIIDRVDIIPAPDTFIQFIMYFKPLTQFKKVDPLLFPDRSKERIGFTAVEWGGVLDH